MLEGRTTKGVFPERKTGARNRVGIAAWAWEHGVCRG